MAKYVKGIIKDTGAIDQPEGSYRYAKNAILNRVKGAVINEHGNVDISSLVPSSYPDTTAEVTVIGSIEITDDRVVYFAKTSTPDTSIIFVLNTDNTTTLVFGTTDGNTGDSNPYDLKFSKDYPIEGTYKIDPDGNLIVYWTDNYNPPRTLNVTRQITEGTSTKLYGVDPATSPNKNYIERLNLFPHAGPVPVISFDSISNGGALKTGVYYLFLAYVDKNFTQTNYVTYSLGVPIVDDDESVLPIERYDGAEADSQTGKAIVWTFSNLNTDYEYIRPVVVARIGDNAQFAYRLNDLDITSRTGNVIFSGLEGYQASSVEDVLLDTVAYDTAKTITQLDGRMYLGNLKGSRDIGFQKNANFIKLTAITSELQDFDQTVLNNDILLFGRNQTGSQPDVDKENGFRGINKLASSTANKRGYTRDEVYAFYIAFILNDGSMSYAYHIPGRDSLTNLDTQTIAKAGKYAFTGSTTVGEKAGLQELALRDITNNEGKVFHFFDTSQAKDASTSELAHSYNTGFWENQNETYPNTDDYRVFDGLVEKPNLDLRGKKVRHHKMPSNATVQNSLITKSNVVIQSLNGGTATEVYYIAWSGTPDNNTQYKFSSDWATGDNNNNVLLPDANKNSTNNAIDFLGTGQARDMMNELQSSFGPQFQNWKLDTPNAGQNGYFIWSKGPSFTANKGGSAARIFYDSTSDQHVVQQFSDNVINETFDRVTAFFAQIEYAIFVWEVPKENRNANIEISQDVKVLGVRFSDIKIPYEIAQKIQGFRIYYAERSHANRRVLGQDLIKNTREGAPWDDADVSGCGPYAGVGSKEAYILSPGTLYNGNVSTATFHDTYLLHGRHSLVSATHTTLEYSVDMLAFRGPGKWYSDVEQFNNNPDLTDENISPPSVCQDTVSFSSYFMGKRYNFVSSDDYIHYPLREKCKTYINGDSIFDGTGLGFGKKVYNLGGESSVLLGFRNGRSPNLGAWRDFANSVDTRPDWSKKPPSSNAPFSYTDGVNNTPSLQLHTLHAFKNDMYLSFDTQQLVWTGYEVIGDDLDKFVIPENGSTPTTNLAFRTNNIFGGDTFITRQGYRITHRPEISDKVPNDHKSIVYGLCESTMNVNFRHETSSDNSYYPGSPAGKVLGLKANVNLTAEGAVKYENHYSLGQADIKAPVPFPLRESDPKTFKTRIQRSARVDNSSLIDNYRVYLALDFKDLPRNRGELWKLVTFNNLLYMHTEDSLFRTKGKESLQLADGAQSFIGSGDIFAQDPDEMVQTESGHGGTNSQWVSLVCKHGYFCLDYRNSKVFLVKDQIYDISAMGLQDWFRDNIPYTLEQYGLPANFDNNIIGVGFHATYDERFNRILLTKNDLVPTQQFINIFNARQSDNEPTTRSLDYIKWDDEKKQFIHYYALNYDPNDIGYLTDDDGNLISTGFTNNPNAVNYRKIPISWEEDQGYFTSTGWTVSFDPELNVWASFHDYVPYFYSYTRDTMLSLQKGNYNIWSHSNYANPGNFYGTVNPFEFEFVFNASRDDDKVFYSFNYITDVYKGNTPYHNPGFTSFYLYGVDQISGEQPLEYMMNVRRVGNEWKVNKFRDVAKLENSTSDVYTGGPGGHSGSNFGVTGANVGGSVTTQVETTTNNPMFNVSGMNETINSSFIDTSKTWNKQRKFTGKWLAIRLIADNSDKNLINLYATDVAAKKFYR